MATPPVILRGSKYLKRVRTTLASRGGRARRTKYGKPAPPSRDHYHLRLLELGPFHRRTQGGWRFGTKVINDSIVERLVASGRAKRIENSVYLVDDAK